MLRTLLEGNKDSEQARPQLIKRRRKTEEEEVIVCYCDFRLNKEAKPMLKNHKPQVNDHDLEDDILKVFLCFSLFIDLCGPWR